MCVNRVHAIFSVAASWPTIVCSESVSLAMASKERGCLWSEEEVTALISIWGEEEIQAQLDGATRNIKVYEKIAAKLSSLENCRERTAVQCREKIKKLKSDYRRAKDSNNRSGMGRTICHFYSQLDAILGCRPSSAPSGVLESMGEAEEVGGQGDVEATQRDSDDEVPDSLPGNHNYFN